MAAKRIRAEAGVTKIYDVLLWQNYAIQYNAERIGATTLSLTTLSQMTFSIIINKTRYSTLSIMEHCCYAESFMSSLTYAECDIATYPLS